MLNSPESYEETRRRHFSYALELLPQYLTRLRWSREQIEAEQTHALRALVRHAVQHSPWHRQRLRHINVDQLTAAQLCEIPPMTKDDLMQNWDVIVTDERCTLAAAEAHLATLTGDAYFGVELHLIASGGSSGTRGVFLYDWHGWAVSWLGLSRGLFALLLHTGPAASGAFATVSSYIATHATSALGQTFSAPDNPTVRAPVTLPLTAIVDILNRTQPAILHTYASMLPPLCEAADSGRLQIHPALIWSTSEPLLPEVRERAEATWKVPVVNGWAASESNGGAFSCWAGSGFHIGEDLNVIEPVDHRGAPVARGERSAKIFLTNLYNRVMPLIRYEITDEFQLADAPCRCGSAYVKVEDVQGRADDIFEYAAGVRVHPLNFRSVLGQQAAVIEYQVRQTFAGAEVDVVARSACDLAALQSILEERLRCVGVSAPEVVVRRVDHIARQGTGKLKRFVPLT